MGLQPESEADGAITDHMATTADELSAVALGFNGGHGGSAAAVEDPLGDPEGETVLVDGFGVGVNDSLPGVSLPEPPPPSVVAPPSVGPLALPPSVPVGAPDPLAPGLAPPDAVPGVVTHAWGLNMDCAEPATATIR